MRWEEGGRVEEVLTVSQWVRVKKLWQEHGNSSLFCLPNEIHNRFVVQQPDEDRSSAMQWMLWFMLLFLFL